MSYFGAAFSRNLRSLRTCLNNSFVLNFNNSRHYCEHVTRVRTGKSVNHVTLLGRVGIDPQLRGTETKPVVVFTLATDLRYIYDESGEFHEMVEWHRISVCRKQLCEVVLEQLKKGSRIYLEGHLSYGKITDSEGVVHYTTTIVASDIMFVDQKDEYEEE